MQAVANGDWGDYVPGEFPDNVSDVKVVSATTKTEERGHTVKISIGSSKEKVKSQSKKKKNLVLLSIKLLWFKYLILNMINLKLN